MTATTVTVGFTRTNRAANYIPTMDGYRPLTPQTEVTFSVDANDATPEQIAEAVYVATNAPAEVIAQNPLTVAVLDAFLDARDAVANEEVHRSLSVGDTVAIFEPRIVIMECSRVGFTRLFHT